MAKCFLCGHEHLVSSHPILAEGVCPLDITGLAGYTVAAAANVTSEALQQDLLNLEKIMVDVSIPVSLRMNHDTWNRFIEVMADISRVSAGFHPLTGIQIVESEHMPYLGVMITFHDGKISYVKLEDKDEHNNSGHSSAGPDHGG